jgi:hypothetical protein
MTRVGSRGRDEGKRKARRRKERKKSRLCRLGMIVRKESKIANEAVKKRKERKGKKYK